MNPNNIMKLSKPMLFKINFNEQTHLTKSKQKYTLQHLLSYIRTAFKKLPESYSLCYIDEDGDQICLETQADLENLLESDLNKVNIRIVEIQKVDDGLVEIVSATAEDLQEMRSELNDSPNQNNTILHINTKIDEVVLKEGVKTEQKNEEENENINFAELPIYISEIKTENKEKEQPKVHKLTVVQTKNQEQQIEKEKEEKTFLEKSLQKMQVQPPKQKNNTNFNPIPADPQNSERNEQIPQQQEENHQQIKLRVKIMKQKIHEGVTCDQCGTENIAGIRYKCTVCFNYDMCEKCQADFDHQHALIKIRYPCQQFEKDHVSIVQSVGGTIYHCSQKIKNKVKTVFGKQSRDQPKKKNEAEEFMVGIGKLRKPKEQAPIPKNEQFSLQDKQIEFASYLNDILGLDFDRCFSFVKKNPGLNQEQLLVQYFRDVKAI